MKTFAMSIAAVAFAGTMTAIPAAAQMDTGTGYDAPERAVVEQMVVETRYYSDDQSTYAILDEPNEAWMIFDAGDDSLIETRPMAQFAPSEQNIVKVDTDRDLQLSAYGEAERATARQFVEQDRYYDAERATYAVFDPAATVWHVYDADSDALIESFAEGDYQPYEPGLTTVRIAPAGAQVGMADTTLTEKAYDEPERKAFDQLQAGMAEERYYNAERTTYSVWDPVQSIWNVFDAATDEVIETFTDNEYDPYEPGYTVVTPGDNQVGMGADGESIAADPTPISDNRQ